jgi:ribosomal protein L15E
MFISAGHRRTERRRTGVQQPEQGAMVVTMAVRKGGSGLRPSSSLMTDSPLPNVTASPDRACRMKSSRR